jgi:uncharacterized protein (DUF2225 family)
MAINLPDLKRRLQALLNDPNLVEEYIRSYGPGIDIKNIKAIKEKNSRTRLCREEALDGKDPMFEIFVTCPICNRENITCYELRAKSQQIQQDIFLIPSYQGANGYGTIDYTFLAVTVCPRCLFASPDKKDFIRQSTGTVGEKKSQLTNNAIITLQEKIGERKGILKRISEPESYFRRPRSYDAAVDSYRLAISRAKVEAWYELPNAMYKMGAYSLRMAKILKQSGEDHTVLIKDGLRNFEDAFRTSNCPSEDIEMQVLYEIVALLLNQGEHNKANNYLAVFTNLKNNRKLEMASNPQLNCNTIDKWMDRAKRLWEDRDDPGCFEF